MSIVGEAVAGAALSAFFDVLFEKLSSADLLKIFGQENVDADLKNWTKKLWSIRAVLIDAEEKQMTDGFVKSWLVELEDLTYYADDILDAFATEASLRKVNAEKSSTSKFRKFILACCLGFNPSSIRFDANMRPNIKEINKKLQELVTLKNDLKLEDCARGWPRTITSRVPATSLLESHTYGRGEAKETIITLLSDESGGAQLSTVSILGMGGLGKTTLAKLVYNDDKVGSYFDVKAWVCVSQNFNILKVTKKILQDVTSETCKDKVLDSVQIKLMKQLSGRKFLFILDDVWNVNFSDWTNLCLPFQSGAHGSKILITTREANVSSIMGAPHPYKLRELSNDACLRIFTQHALGTSDFVEHLKVEERQKILERCKGLPLAAKALAGLLRTYDRDEWKNVLNGRIWDLLEEKTDVPSTLRLSYLCLPSSLKKCFAYCSIFPKDYNFAEKELVLLWMAAGLVRETKGEKPMEDLGGEYFRDLLKRSFFQQSSSYRSLFVMHDLMHELAQWAAGDFFCRVEDQLGGSKISTKVRHFSYTIHSSNCIEKFGDLSKDMHLRTFLLLPSRFISNLTKFGAICSLPQLRCLRVLSLSGNDIFELSSIGNLQHLRYLNLSCTKIKSLPESISSLYNLQTLILKGCNSLTKVPEEIGNLVNLRHLNISKANSIREMPAGITKLKSLRTLCFKDMDEWQGPFRVEGKEFPCLRELSISNCPKLGEFSYYLPSLEKLSIHACEQLVVSILRYSVIQVLEIVECKQVVHGSMEVEKLIIKDCKELTSLYEDGLMSFVTLEIKIKSCQSLVNIKLKSTLRTLTIKGCSALESLQFLTDEVGASSTSSCLLEHLKISNCPSLKCVSTIVNLAAMLNRLDIEECPNLKSLSSKATLPSTLKVLKLENCPKLKSIKLNKDTLLEDLLIYSCKKLGRLPRCLRELCHLKRIVIFDCNSLEKLKALPTNLRHLEIDDCEKLKALPNNIHNLNFLQYLLIRGCPRIVSFPEEGFPTSLRKLWLSGVKICKQVFKLGLHRLKSLTLLSIAGGMMDTFPEEEDGKKTLMLPTSLTTLYIEKCPKLASLSEKCFPPSLQELNIIKCPVLEQHCKKGKGIMWSMIANIPSVTIDHRKLQK